MAFTENKGIIGFDSELSEGHLVRLLKGPFPEFIGELGQVNDVGHGRILFNFMGAGSRLVEDRFPCTGSLAVQAASAGGRDPVEWGMNRMLCHPERGSVCKWHNTICSGSSALLAQPAHG